MYLHLLREHAVRVPEVRPEVGMVHHAIIPRREHVGGRGRHAANQEIFTLAVLVLLCCRRPQLTECCLGKDRRRRLVKIGLEKDHAC